MCYTRETILPHTFVISFRVALLCFLLPQEAYYSHMLLKSWNHGSGSHSLFSHRLALYNVWDCPPTRPCSLMREDTIWGLDGWVLELSLAQTVKRLPAMRETRVWFLSLEDPLEKEMAIRSSTLAWKIPWKVEPHRLQSMGSQRVLTEWLHFHFHFTFCQMPAEWSWYLLSPWV